MGMIKIYYLILYFVPVLLIGWMIAFKFELIKRLLGDDDIGVTFEELMMVVFLWPLWPLFLIIEKWRNR
jgi:hypothetical protein